MIKYIFSDLDGTLLSSDKTISYKNKEIIKKANDNGVKFIVNSGRLPYSFRSYKKDFDLNYFVSGNGSLIKRDGKIVYSKPLSCEDAKRIAEIAYKYDAYARCFSLKKICLFKFDTKTAKGVVNKPYGFFDKKTVNNLEEMFKFIDNHDIYKIGFFDDHEKLERVKNSINIELKNVNTSYSTFRFLENHDINTSKGNAIKEVCKLFNIDYDEVLAIGDNGNDMSMIDNAFHSACPANATDEIKCKCEYISDRSCDEDAIFDIVSKFCNL